MRRSFIAAALVALTGLSCLNAPPQEEKDQEGWVQTGAGKIVARAGLIQSDFDKQWDFYYEISDGKNTQMVRVTNHLTLTDALTLHEQLRRPLVLGDSLLIPIYDGEMTKDTLIKGWSWSR